MYFWHTGKLTCQLKHHTVSSVGKLVYLFIFIVQYATGFLVFQAVPTVYRMLFAYAKEQLEMHTGHPSLMVKVHQTTPEWFPSALTMIVIIGFIACFFAHYPHNLRLFIDRFICLNTPISLRILFVSLLFFGLAMLFGGLHFANEFLELQESVTHVPAGTFSSLWSYFSQLTGLRYIIEGLALLEGAQHIFKDINVFSFYAHTASYSIALVSTALYFWQMQKQMRCITSQL